MNTIYIPLIIYLSAHYQLIYPSAHYQLKYPSDHYQRIYPSDHIPVRSYTRQIIISAYTRQIIRISSYNRQLSPRHGNASRRFFINVDNDRIRSSRSEIIHLELKFGLGRTQGQPQVNPNKRRRHETPSLKTPYKQTQETLSVPRRRSYIYQCLPIFRRAFPGSLRLRLRSG